MDTERELDHIDEIEEVSEEVQESTYVEEKQRKTALNHYKDIEKEDGEAHVSEDEIEIFKDRKESRLNLERVVEALEVVMDGVLAPVESEEISFVEENIPFEETENEDSESEEEPKGFHITLEPISEGQPENPEAETEDLSNKSPGKKEEEAVFKNILNEIEKLHRKQLEELIKM